MKRQRGLFILDHEARQLIYGPDEMRAIGERVELVAPPQTRASVQENLELLEPVDLIFSGWGAPVLDVRFLDAAPHLKVFFYGSGTVGHVTTDAVWDRGVAVTTAIQANSRAVAEYSLSTILFCLKHGWRLARETRERRTFVDRNAVPGCYGSTVGIVSLGAIARILLKLLKPFDLKIVAHDPYVSAADAAAMGVELVSLDEMFRTCDVASVHTPLSAETQGLITGVHLASMKRGATFINTARGQIVRQEELIAVAVNRPDMQFVLDVAEPEPPPPDCPLYTLDNVMLTPHIAGSTGNECRRMGRYMVEELERYVSGQPLRWAVAPAATAVSSRRPPSHRFDRVTLGPAVARSTDAAALLP